MMEWKRISDGNLPNYGWVVFGHENMEPWGNPRIDFVIPSGNGCYFDLAIRHGYTHYFILESPTPKPETPSPQPQSPDGH